MTQWVETYAETHSDEEPEILRRLGRHTHVKHINGRMQSGHLQGRLLTMLCRMIQPKRILEAGTFTGYAAICLAEGSGPDAYVDTIERNDELETEIRYWLNESGYAARIRLHIGDALKVIPTLTETYDLAFLDLDKRLYSDCYEAILRVIRPGGFILVDNTLWNGKIAGEIAKNDTQTLAISKFNDYIAQDKRVDKVLLPIRDGLTILHKR